MPKQRFLNNFTSTFIAAVKDAPSSGTPETELDYGVLRISDGAAGLLLNPTDGDYYLLTAFKRSGSVESNIEVMRVTGVSNATPGECRITVQRAQEGTSAKAFVAGDYLSLRITKGTAENFAQPDDMAQKVDKVTGKGLSTEDYTTAEKAKLAGVAEGAQVNTVNSVAGKTGAVTLEKGDVGLGSVDNTADVDKPVSTAQASALAGKEPTITAPVSAPTEKYWRGDKAWRDFFTDVRAATLTGLSTATNSPVAATDTVLQAVGKLQAQVNAAPSGAFREKLTAPRTYYVSTTGSDSNDGLTSGAPFLTIQKAVNTAAALDNGGFDITIRLLAGTYTTGFELRSFVGAGKIVVRGDANDSTSSVISTTSASCVASANSTVGVYRLEYLKLQTTTSGYGIVLNGGTNCVEISNINFGACASLHMSSGSGSTINAVGVSYTISGSAPGHIEAADGGVFRNQFSNVTLSGSLNFNPYAYATRQGYMSIYSTTFTGSASGARYSATNGGGIFVGGGGASYLPGNSAGSVTTTGWYE